MIAWIKYSVCNKIMKGIVLALAIVLLLPLVIIGALLFYCGYILFHVTKSVVKDGCSVEIFVVIPIILVIWVFFTTVVLIVMPIHLYI